MQTEWKIFGILLVIGVIVAGAFIGLFVLTAQEEPEQVITPTLTPIPTSIPTPTPVQQPTVDTSDWQTYRNEEFGFEVKYSGSWEKKENGVLHKTTGSEFSVIKNNNPNNLTLDEWFQKATLIGGRPTVKAAAEAISINGIKAYRFNSDLPAPALYFEIVAIANIQGDIYSIYGNYQVVEDANMLDQILSTFRFINIEEGLTIGSQANLCGGVDFPEKLILSANIDSDSEEEKVVLCQKKNDETYGYILLFDKIDNEYRRIWGVDVIGDISVGELRVLDIDGDGIDEIVFESFGTTAYSGTAITYIYAPKFDMQFQGSRTGDLRYLDEFGNPQCSEEYSSNLQQQEFQAFRDFLEQESNCG